jgi:16S rRNA U516 pseudouridylate synthase RsuA-like enzyme
LTLTEGRNRQVRRMIEAAGSGRKLEPEEVRLLAGPSASRRG